MRTAALFPFVLASLVPAQVQGSATGALVVSWQGSAGPQSQSQPIGGALTTLTLSGVGSASLAVGATTTLSLLANSPPFGFGYWSAASGDALVTWTAPAPVAGVFAMQMTPACLMSPPFVDVNDDGTWELGWAGGTATVPVVLGPTPVKVRMSAQTVNFGGANCAYTVTVTFAPNPTNLQTVQRPCGPSLSATLQRATLAPASNGELKLHVGGMTGVIGVLFAGSVLTPGASCGPASNADASLLITPGPGSVSIPLVIPPAVLGVFSLQYVDVVLPFQLRWSNAVQATLP